MATLVTGGTGFVGSNIVKALAERGHEVVSFDIVAPNALVEKYLKPWAEQVTFLQGDMLIEADLEPLAAHGVSKIVHAGVFTGVLPEVEAARSRSIVDINVMATTNLLELASRLSVERFLYVSSGSVYGEGHDPDGTLHEDSPLQPRSLYAVTKYTSELLTRRYGELHGFQTVSVRLGGPYGPMERVTGHRANQSLMKDWTGRLVRDEPIEVSDRTLRRSYTYVPDIAAGICAVLDAPSLSHDVYNNSSTANNSLEEMIEILRDIHPGLRVVDSPSSDVPGSAYRLDVIRLRQDLGFAARFDLASGLQDYIAWRRAENFTD